MNAPVVRGACPALSAPMQTGDGLLVRLSPADGRLTPQALAGLAEAAFRHGNSILEVTARGSLQLRGLEPATVGPLAEDVVALGIEPREGVPVELPPLAGLDPTERADPRPLAAAIRAELAGLGLAARLGPKVSVAVDGRGRLGLDDLPADLRCEALRDGDTTAWLLSIGGDAAEAAPLAIVAEAHVATAARLVLGAIAELGRQGRGRHLSPPMLRSLILRHTEASREPDRIRYDRSGDVGSRRRTAISPVGLHPLRDGRAALGVSLPFGQTEASRLAGFAAAAAAAGAAEIRPAPGRALLVLPLPTPQAAELQALAPRFGLIADAADPRLHLAACPGSPACASGHAAARVLAEQLSTLAGAMLDGSFSVHVSGCAKGCAHPAAAGLTFVGRPDGIGLLVGGKASDVVEVRLPHGEIRHGFARLAGLYREARRPGEDAGACLSRIGPGRIAEAFRGHP